MVGAHLHGDVLWNVVLAVIEIAVAYCVGKLARRLVIKLISKASDKGILTFFASFINIFCEVVGVIIALDQLGVDMNLIIGALSALGVGISLALKDNMASVASGMQLLLTKPFKVGDYIRMGKHEGMVRSIEMTFTTLETRNNETVIIPNNSLIIKTVTNLSDEPYRRVVITYPSSMDHINRNKSELVVAAKTSQLVLNDPAPVVTITSYQMDGATLELLAYTKPENYWKCSAEIMDNIHRLQDQGLIDQTGQASEISDDEDPDTGNTVQNSSVSKQQ